MCISTGEKHKLLPAWLLLLNKTSGMFSGYFCCCCSSVSNMGVKYRFFLVSKTHTDIHLVGMGWIVKVGWYLRAVKKHFQIWNSTRSLSTEKAGWHRLLWLSNTRDLCPSCPGLQGLWWSPSRAADGMPKQTAPTWTGRLFCLCKAAQPRRRFHSPWLCKAVPWHGSLWQGWKRELWPRAHVPGITTLFLPQSASLCAGKALVLMQGVIWAPCHQGTAAMEGAATAAGSTLKSRWNLILIS